MCTASSDCSRACSSSSTGALLVDGYLPFSLGQVLIPATAPYRPLGASFGVVAAELLAALALTNRYRASLSYRFWRRAH